MDPVRRGERIDFHSVCHPDQRAEGRHLQIDVSRIRVPPGAPLPEARMAAGSDGSIDATSNRAPL
jgi:hypothetical protein